MVIIKKISKILAIVISVVVIGYVFKYFNDLNFKGNEDIILIDNYKGIKTLNELISRKDFKGKVLYIDLWGVYCRPCIEEFRHMPAIRERYDGTGVSFVYLASPYKRPDDEQKWKAALKKYQLKGHHILMDMEFYNGIWDEVSGMDSPFLIPHYLLVDKNGEIVLPNAPRPSDREKLFKQIDNLL